MSVFRIPQPTMEQGTQMKARERRCRVTRAVRRAPVRRNLDEATFEDDREIVIGGGDDKPQVSA